MTKLADELKADVVIVGSRNPNIQTHLLGSEAAGIVRYAHVPVLWCVEDGLGCPDFRYRSEEITMNTENRAARFISSP